ncbi:MAG: DMT family transporter [Aeromicrobium sp.]
MNRLATIALLAVTAVWGSTFFLIKDLLDRVPASDFLALRFAIATVALLVLAPRAWLRLSAQTRRRAVIAGAVYGLAQLLQTVGLGYTDASVSGFITGLYVVATPVIAAGAFGMRIDRRVWGAVALATAGLAILSLRGSALGYGESITVAGALLYAVHIVLLSRWTRAEDALGMATVQMATITVVSTLFAAPGGITLPDRAGDWWSVLYMAVVAGALAMLAQTWAQAHLDAARSALVMTMEPVFAAAFAVVLGSESVHARLIVGGLLVVSGMVLAERSGRPIPQPGQSVAAGEHLRHEKCQLE